LNVSIMGSFLSLTKIALINGKVRDAKDSARIFFAHSLAGVLARAVVLAVSFGFLFIDGLVVSAAVFLAFLAGAYLWGMRSGVSGRLSSILPRLSARDAGLVAVLGLFTVLCTAFAQYALVADLSRSDPGFAAVLFSEQAGVLSGFFSPMPAGLGVREVVMTESLASFRVSRESAFSASVVARFILVFSQVLLASCAQAGRLISAWGKIG